MSKEIKGKKYGRLYLESYKKTVVSQVEQEGSLMLLCDRLGLNRKTVSSWMKVYGSANYADNRRLRRPLTERNRIAREVISGKLSLQEVQLKYSITCRDTLTLWIRQYRKSLPNVSQTALEFSPDESSSTPRLPSIQDIGLAELRIRALETMLDIASKEFNVDIRKKFGAKQ